ncbi:hypothetical protein ACFPTO_08640 [Paraburkholderia denitrificans]|uniref:Uncharacterized protein n=1 Tax=Paraburkholderia denitrificans TaxID=694025 RepID=A0ABW0J776_9BURK
MKPQIMAEAMPIRSGASESGRDTAPQFNPALSRGEHQLFMRFNV